MAGSTPRIVIRVDASTTIGTGHVMRCVTLAERLKQEDADVRFVCRELDGHLCGLIEDRGFSLERLPVPASKVTHVDGPAHAAWLGVSWEDDAAQTLASISHLAPPHWIVVDHYALDARWEQHFRKKGIKIMAIDDLADRLHDCDILLDQNLVAHQSERYFGKTPERCTLLLGPGYALLDSEYARLRPRASPREGQPRRVLVSFGGIDKYFLTEKTVNALVALEGRAVEADIVLSSTSPQFQQIESKIEGVPNLRLHDRLTSLAHLMLGADLAIGASGTTNWERLCLGLPTLVVTVAENQRPTADELSRRGLVHWLGDADTVDQNRIQSALEGILDAGLGVTWSEKCLEIVDGRGAARVCAVLLAEAGMSLSVRHAELRDESMLLDWANDRATRENAFNPKPITPQEHRAWFRARLRQPDYCVLYIIETISGIPMGQVRFDRRSDEWEISYCVAPLFRGRRVGQSMLEDAIRHLQKCHGNVSLFGQVKLANAPSRRIFESLNFSTRVSGPDRIIYERCYSK
ncbi:UDP-2,4-diacetamido-2,4,6-trideoxy-beta-L-altropyranose hydrolase [Mesorhizobium sp. WSM2239]|uniref:UDP-2,4-diacetamido-2,4, 6-trideoxy-beta-L-altropyranose hydrolase n=2 Tax=unclassified Mesorhizobium TaxID=325217 RepID=A0AAU8DG32_9HYPH